MNTKNKKNVINDEKLETVTGGTAPDLPATTLESEGYSGMFSDPTTPGQYEPHFYDGKVVDPTHFTKETLK